MKSSNGNNVQSLLTYSDARTIDRICIENGNSASLLMGLAASGALHHLKQDFLPDFWERNELQLVILCGSGNNGGDGLALASLLSGDPERRPGDSASARMRIYARLPMQSATANLYESRLNRADIPIYDFNQFDNDCPMLASIPGLIILEGLLGTGQNRKPAGHIAAILKTLKLLLADNSAKLVSLDIPAGLTESDPAVFDRVVTMDTPPLPDMIYTFGFEKAASAFLPGVKIRRIGCGFEPNIEKQVLNASSNPTLYRYDLHTARTDLSQYFARTDSDHKYSSGHAWMIAGEENMEGAALLALQSFLVSGGGYVRLFHPDSASRDRYLSVLPSALYQDVRDFTTTCENEKVPQSILIGPGLTFGTIKAHRNELLTGLRTLASRSDSLTVILDAAASALAFDEHFPSALRPTTIITPHRGEWKSIGGPVVETVASLHSAMEFLSGIQALLKGPVSVCLSPERIVFFSSPRPQLAVAGSGDLFAGILLRAASGHAVHRPMQELVQAAIHLQYHSAEHSAHPEQQLRWLQEHLDEIPLPKP